MPGTRTSTELRTRIIAWSQEDKSIDEIVALSGRSRSTVYSIIQTFERYGQVNNPNKRSAGRRRLLERADVEHLSSIIKSTPSIYLDEIQEKLLHDRNIEVSLATLSRELARLAISRKGVAREASERNELLRAIWRAEIGQYEPQQLVFMDESAVDDQTSHRREGWAPIGMACVSRTTFLRGVKYSILPALSLDGIIALEIFEGSVNREKFIQFLRSQVVSCHLTVLLRNSTVAQCYL